jgi:dihydroflavonol-4-reductase
MKTILVTGSTGFLGAHLVEQLQQHEPGARLRLLRRGTAQRGGAVQKGGLEQDTDPERISDAASNAGSAVELIQGDITSRQDVSRAAEGTDEIYHLAGVVDREAKDYWRQYTTHVEGVRNICEAIKQHRVGKAVHVSSSGTIAVGPDPVEYDETAAYKNDVVAEWPYYLSKIYSEKLALHYAREEGLPLVIVNPSLLLGPGDERLSSTGDVALFLDGQILAIPTGGLSLLDARDAAGGLIAAMRSGRPGERYLLGGANLTFHEWIRMVSKISGVPAPKLMVPPALSLFGARLMRKAYPLVGKQFHLDDASVKMSSLFWYCDTSKARRELAFSTRDPLETIRDTVKDLQKRKRTGAAA